MARQFQEGPGEGFAGGGPQGGIVAPQFLLFTNGAGEALGDIAFGGGANPGVLLGLGEERLDIEFIEPPGEAFEHLLHLFGHVGQLAIGEAGQVGHVDLAVVTQGQEGGTHAATSLPTIALTHAPLGGGNQLPGALGTHGLGGASRTASPGYALPCRQTTIHGNQLPDLNVVKPTTPLGLRCPWPEPYANGPRFEGGSPQGDAKEPPPQAF